MPHIELPLKDSNEGRHITLVHFPYILNTEQGAGIVEGMEALGAIYGEYMYDMFYGEKVYFGPTWNKVLVGTVELGTNALLDLRKRLVDGIRARFPEVAISEDYGPEWHPHVTNPPYDMTPWRPIHYHRRLTLVQDPHRIDVPFPDPAPE